MHLLLLPLHLPLHLLLHLSVPRVPLQVNETHVELRNVLRVTLTEEQTIARHDLTLVWACVFPRHALRSTGLSAGLDWLVFYCEPGNR